MLMEKILKDFVTKPNYELPQGICAEGVVLITGLKTLRDSPSYKSIDKEIRHAIVNIANVSKINAVCDLDEEEQPSVDLFFPDGYPLRITDLAAPGLIVREAGGELYTSACELLEMRISLEDREEILAVGDPSALEELYRVAMNESCIIPRRE